MKTMNCNDQLFEEKQAVELAVGTFIISTILFILYIISNESPTVLVVAWPFAASAIILNTIMLIHLLDRFIHLPNYRKDIAINILILVSNIPITFLYYTIVI